MEIAFHVTPADNLPNILQVGLEPKVGPRARHPAEQPAVYLFPDRQSCNAAVAGWLGNAFNTPLETELIILEVDITGLPYQRGVELDKEVLVVIPANRIKKIRSKDWRTMPKISRISVNA